jgi:hypothetical protein
MENLEGRDQLGDTVVMERLKWISKEEVVRM